MKTITSATLPPHLRFTRKRSACTKSGARKPLTAKSSVTATGADAMTSPPNRTVELTWLRDHPQAYDIGEEEFHLAFRVDDFAAAHALHSEMGCICFENDAMGIYFIQDPDGYWLEIVPTR